MLTSISVIPVAHVCVNVWACVYGHAFVHELLDPQTDLAHVGGMIDKTQMGDLIYMTRPLLNGQGRQRGEIHFTRKLISTNMVV